MTTTPDPVDVFVGQRVRSLRLAQGKSQSDLAKALGLTFQQVQKYERGANRVSASMLHRIAKFLIVEPGYFFPVSAGEETNSPPTLDLGAAPNGHELARLYVAAGPACRTAIIQCARAVTAPALQQAA